LEVVWAKGVQALPSKCQIEKQALECDTDALGQLLSRAGEGSRATHLRLLNVHDPALPAGGLRRRFRGSWQSVLRDVERLVQHGCYDISS
jgi:hypothetical protein